MITKDILMDKVVKIPLLPGKSRYRFAGFWCRKCGGRVLEDEIYWDGDGVKTITLTCLHCGKEHNAEHKSYLHLLDEIERAIRNKTITKTDKA